MARSSHLGMILLLLLTAASMRGTACAATVAPMANSTIDYAFSPDGGVTDLVVQTIGTARTSIRVAAYSFTSRPIAQALAAARARGVDVALVMDHEEIEARNHSIAPWLAQQGVPMRVDIMHALQHNKFMIVDGDTLETGSFNFTAAAEHHNAENVLILHHMPQLAAAYAADWQALWDQAETYKN